MQEEGGEDFQQEVNAGVDVEREGHFCSKDEYPCGADNDMVHVCHHSSRFGYQTFCVPEPDSDIVGLYSKDYCGPCIGGFRPTLRGSSAEEE